MSYTSWSLVYGEQPSTAKWNILGTNDAHFYSFLGDNTAWQSWTPTWTNVTIGNGTVSAKYTKIGKTVFCRISFLLGTTSAWSASVPTFTMPSTSVSSTRSILGTCMIEDASAGSYLGWFKWASTTTIEPVCGLATGTYSNLNRITTTAPMTWASTDYLRGHFSYEEA